MIARLDAEDTPENTYTEMLQNRLADWVAEFMKSDVIFPIVDYDTAWDSDAESKAVMNVASYGLPAFNKNWDGIDMTSDDALSHIAFSGVAAHRLTTTDSPAFAHDASKEVQALAKSLNARYVVDFDFMKDLPVRAGFEAYGACLFLSAAGTPIGIHWWDKVVKKGDKDWEHAKFVWRSSAVVGVTLVDHLVGTHLMMSNFVAIAQKENLSPDHPIRRFLKPFSFRAFAINRAASINLVDYNGILHHTVALTWEGLKSGFKFAYGHHRYFTVPQFFQLHGIDPKDEKHSFASDLLDFNAIVVSLVGPYVDLYYPTPESMFSDRELMKFWDGVHTLPDSKFPQLVTTKELKDMLVSFVVAVSAIHHHVGNVAEYLNDARVASGKIRPGKDIGDVQASFQAILICLLTGRKQPKLIGDWAHILLKDDKYEKTSKLFSSFNTDLSALSDKILSLNKKRLYPSEVFDPKQLLSSVSI